MVRGGTWWLIPISGGLLHLRCDRRSTVLDQQGLEYRVGLKPHGKYEPLLECPLCDLASEALPAHDVSYIRYILLGQAQSPDLQRLVGPRSTWNPSYRPVSVVAESSQGDTLRSALHHTERSRRPIMSGISLMNAGYRLASAIMGSAGIFRTMKIRPVGHQKASLRRLSQCGHRWRPHGQSSSEVQDKL
jgi:hypothetical protein